MTGKTGVGKVRVMHFLAMRMISSGPLQSMEEFDAFDRWWSAIDTKEYITSRDFLYYDGDGRCFVWLFAPPREFNNTSGYECVDFPGGLCMSWALPGTARRQTWMLPRRPCGNGLKKRRFCGVRPT